MNHRQLRIDSAARDALAPNQSRFRHISEIIKRSGCSISEAKDARNFTLGFFTAELKR